MNFSVLLRPFFAEYLEELEKCSYVQVPLEFPPDYLPLMEIFDGLYNSEAQVAIGLMLLTTKYTVRQTDIVFP